MKLKDCLDIDRIFHPTLFYDSEWLLGGALDFFNEKEDYIVMNSKKKGKLNLYEEFLEKHYYEPLGEIMNSKTMVRSYKPRINFTYDKEGKRRIVAFSFSNYVFQQILSLNLFKYPIEKIFDKFGENCSRDQLINESTMLLKEEKKCFEDLIINNFNSKYYKEAYEVYKYYVNNSNFKQSFSDFVNLKIRSLDKMISSNGKVLEFFEKEIDIKSLLGCFDYDMFCLLLARSVLDTCKITEQIKGLVDDSVCVVKEYLMAVEMLRKSNKNYSCQIIVPAEKKGRKKIITIKDIENEFNALMIRHPEFSFIQTNDKQLQSLLGYYGLSSNEIDLSSKDGGELLSLLFQMIEKEKDLFASWVILPRGEIDNRNSKSTELGEKRHNTIDNDLHIKRMLFSRDFLNNSPYKYRLSGINKFEGYIGYIYSNGVVLFEKFYENEKTGRIAKNSATYVMNIYNFLELSKLSRSEIIKSLKDGSITDVYRIFHSENMEKWKQDVSRAITGSDYSNVDLEYITDLINQNTLSKRRSF